jgi:acyl phosphate:glycerol-3-phosphate acyltransferase
VDAVIPALIGYTIGSLPFGFLVTNRLKGIDLRRVGSGNVGAANVYRTAGLTMALVVVAIDVAKGSASVLLAPRVAAGLDAQVTAGVAAIVGHVYPVWLRFRGGKGVATACGVFMTLAPTATTLAAACFAATVWITRYVSLGSVLATAALTPLAWAFDSPVAVVAGATIAALLIIPRHAGNLARLAGGTERRLGQRP